MYVAMVAFIFFHNHTPCMWDKVASATEYRLVFCCDLEFHTCMYSTAADENFYEKDTNVQLESRKLS